MNSQAAEEIKNRIVSRLVNPASQLEGSFATDNAQAVSFEFARVEEMLIKDIPDMVMLDTAEGVMLDIKALEYGAERKKETYVTGVVTITGDENTIIAKDTKLVNNNNEFLIAALVTIPQSGQIIAPVEAIFIGDKQILIDGQTAFKTLLQGVSLNDLKLNSQELVIESDDDFRNRIYKKIRKTITSGSASDYEEWAAEVAGISTAKCLPLHAGAGTVKVIVLSADFDVPSPILVSAVADYIETVRPVGANVTVEPATLKSVQISIDAVLESGYDLQTVKSAIKTKLEQYIQSITFDEHKVLSYFKIGDLIFNVDGIIDITDYTLNSGKQSISQGFEEFIKLDGVTLNGT